MSKDQYLEMCAQMGEDPDWEKCPPDWTDFPDIIIDSMNIFNSLGSRIYPEIGYVGKDFTNFDFLLKLYNIKDHHIDFVYEIIMMMESRTIDASQRKLKAEYDKLKRK
tara:strand:+ start:2701 stop:3024 length:324 start_codon:yes stop_codon:yes gene_type:complete